MYDLVVLGGGSAGYSAAMTALEYKKKICIIEKGPFGGLCILKGCMPSKTLIHSARIAEIIKNASKYGVNVSGKVKFNVPKLISRKNKIIQGFADYRLKNVKKNHKDIDLIYGEGKFISKNEIKVGNKIIKGKNFLISTGSKTSQSPFQDLNKIGYITSDEALELKELPKSMAFLGGGPVALELAYYFANLGVESTIIQRSSHILNQNDKDLAIVLEKSFRKNGIKIYSNTELKKFSKTKEGKEIEVNQGKKKIKLKVEEIFLGFGRCPNVDNLGLENLNMKLDEKKVPILNEHLQTSIKNIYVAGDSNGLIEVVNIAVEHGKVSVENMFGEKKQKVDFHKFPMAVFTHPEVAWIGVTETEAKEKNMKVKIGKLPYEDLGKAVCYGEEEGFIKFIVDKKTKKILGVGIVGHLASDIIHEAVPLLYFNATLEDLNKMQHIHPTFGEIFSYLVEKML